MPVLQTHSLSKLYHSFEFVDVFGSVQAPHSPSIFKVWSNRGDIEVVNSVSARPSVEFPVEQSSKFSCLASDGVHML